MKTSTLIAIERFLPPYRYGQDEVTRWVRSWLEERGDDSSSRLLNVYATAGVARRASVVPIEEVFFPGDFETQNDRYREHACRAALDLSRRALEAAEMRPLTWLGSELAPPVPTPLLRFVKVGAYLAGEMTAPITPRYWQLLLSHAL